MKKNYSVEVKVHFRTYSDGSEDFYDDYEWTDMVVKDIEYEDIEEYVKAHRPRLKYVNDGQQYMITKVEVTSIDEVDENGNFVEQIQDPNPLGIPSPNKVVDKLFEKCSGESEDGFNPELGF